MLVPETSFLYMYLYLALAQTPSNQTPVKLICYAYIRHSWYQKYAAVFELKRVETSQVFSAMLKFSSLVIEDINILTAVLKYTDHIITKEGRVVSAGKGIRVTDICDCFSVHFSNNFCYFLSIFYSVFQEWAF